MAGESRTVAKYDVSDGSGDGNPVAVIGAAHGPGDCSSLAVDPSNR